MRAENRSDGASGEILKRVLQIISRQYEKRSRSLIASVDHETIPATISAEKSRKTLFFRTLRSEPIRLRYRPRRLLARCLYNRAANHNCEVHHNAEINSER